jgi:hypothetical protein
VLQVLQVQDEKQVRVQKRHMLKLNKSCEVSQLDVIVVSGETLRCFAVGVY